jgi:hypothetical protein
MNIFLSMGWGFGSEAATQREHGGAGVRYGRSGGREGGSTATVPGRWLEQGCERAWGKGIRYDGPAVGSLLWADPKEQWHL